MNFDTRRFEEAQYLDLYLCSFARLDTLNATRRYWRIYSKNSNRKKKENIFLEFEIFTT